MKYIILTLGLLLSISFIKLSALEAPKVFISEILPDAEGTDSGKEWIELFNNSLEPINLNNFYFINRSSSGSERKISITSSISIPSKQFFLISEGVQNIASENILIIGSGKINMYNDSSDLELYDSDGALVDKIHYSKPIEARGVERKGPENIEGCNNLVAHPSGNTILNINLAKDQICNGLPEIVNPPVTNTCLSIGLINSNLVDTNICVEGTLSVDPDILGEKIFYILEGGLGLKIRQKNVSSILLKEGDKVKVSGIVKSVKDGIYIYSENIELFGSNNISPTLLNNLALQKYSFVKYSGEVMKKYSKSMDLEFGDSLIRISVLASTNLELPQVVIGDKVKVKGILVEEAGIFKILPRYSEDIEVLDEEIVISKSTIKSLEEVTKSEEVKTSKPNLIINKFPESKIVKTNLSREVSNKYSLNRSWFLIASLTILVSLITFLKRQYIISKLKLYQSLENATIDFEKDKYELMFEEGSK